MRSGSSNAFVAPSSISQLRRVSICNSWCRDPFCFSPKRSPMICLEASENSMENSSFESSNNMNSKENNNSDKGIAVADRSLWKWKLIKASNFASAVCVLDCTVLPLVNFLLPVLGLLSLGASQMEFLHELGHKLALYFVLPVGFTATTTNYFWNHRKISISFWGYLGLVIVGLSNWGHGGFMIHHHHHHHAAANGLLATIRHGMQHGLSHRISNLTGCFFLIFSNYLSRKSKPEGSIHTHGPNCNHKHD